MKRLIFILAILCCGISCVGQKEDVLGSYLSLTADRRSVDIDENTPVTFTVTDGGRDITAEAEIYEVVNGVLANLVEGNSFKPDEERIHVFAAVYNGAVSAEVRVDAYSTEAGKNEGRDYFRRYLVLDFTGTWCVNCPNMAEAVHLAGQDDEFYDRMVEVAVHSIDEFEISVGKALVDKWGYNSLPRVVVDVDKNTEISVHSAALVQQKMRQTKAYFPHPCGIKVDSRSEGENLEINVEVAVTADGNYKIGALLLRDGVVAPQKGAADNYVHSSILAASLSGDITAGVNLGEGSLSSGDTVSHSFSYELNKIADFANTRIVVYVMGQYGDQYVVNNTVQCAAGSSVGYRYERK